MATVQRVRGRSVTASELESLGKTAARLGETSGISLTEACVRTLESEGLNAEQVRRCVEHCNINAVNAKYASLRGLDRVVHIDGGPADPVTVIESLEAGSVKTAQLVALEYSAAPSYEKRAVRLPDGPRPNIPKLASKLKQAHAEVVDLCTGLEFRMEQRLEELKVAAQRAANDGASLRDLASSWSNLHPSLAKVATHTLRGQLPWSDGKVAARAIDPSHPAMAKFASFVEVALEFHRAVSARQNLEAELGKVASFLEQQLC